MNKKLLKIIVIVCVVSILATLPLAACSSTTPTTSTTSTTTTAASGQTLKIGVMTPTTGPAAEKGAPGGHGILDCIEYINTELGGVDGHPIEAVWRDSGYDAARIATIVKEFIDSGVLMFTTHASKEMTAAMELANRAGLPGMSTFTAPEIYRPPQHIYGQMPDYGDDFTAFMNYYLENIWKGEGKPKVALHLLNNSTGYGARDAATAMADELGIEIVATEEHTATTISETESLTRIKAKNPDVLYISSTPAPTSVIIKNARDLGMYPGVTIGLGHAGITKALVDLAGADVVEGVYGVYPTVSWDDNVPGIAKAAEYCQKNNPKDYGNMDYLSTWTSALIVRQILKNALEAVGYDALAQGNAESWALIEKDGIQKLNGYDVEGLHGPVTYTPGDNRLDKDVKLYQIQSGKITAITDWISAPLIKYEEFPWWGNK